MAKQAFKLRFDLLLLDCIGCVFFGLGMAKMFANLDWIPPAYQFDDTGWLMIGLGGMLMLPFLLNILWQIRDSIEGQRFK